MNATRMTVGVVTATVAAMVVSCAQAASPKGETAAAIPASDAAAPHSSETLTPLLEQALPNVPGKTFTSAVVSFPPGARAVPHRHGDAFLYAYVVEGAVSSQLEGETAHVYHQGEYWTEQPGVHHLATENISSTESATLLVVFVATTGEHLKVDDPHK